MTRLGRTSWTFLLTAALLATGGLLNSTPAKAARPAQTPSVPTIYIDTLGGYYDARPDVPSPTYTTPAGALDQVNADPNHNIGAFVNVEVVDPLNPLNNFEDTVGTGEIKGRGNYTWQTLPYLGTPPTSDWVSAQNGSPGPIFSPSQVSKRPYQFKLSSKHDILGMGSAKTWILLANHTDGSLMRNKVALDLANQLNMPGTPEARFVDFVLNGSYRGSYLLTEKVQEGGTRAKLTKPNGVLVELDNNYYSTEPFYFISSTGTAFVLKDAAGSGGVPNRLKGGSVAPLSTEVQAGWDSIRAKINQFESLLYSATPDLAQISQVIDVDSFLRFYFVEEFTENPELARSSIYFYQQTVGGKLYAGPVWDFDSSLGNYSTVDKGGNPNILYAREIGKYRGGNTYFQRLFAVPGFDAAARTLYQNEVKLAVDEIFAKTTHYEPLLAASAAKNFAKYQILGGYKLFPPFQDRFSSTWAGEVNRLRSYIVQRVAFLDNYYAPGISGNDCKANAGATAAIGTPGAFNSLAPCRMLDTRTGNGASQGKVGPNGEVSLKVTGRGGVPATGVSAVTLNVTVADPTNAGFVVAYPSDAPQAPDASNLNYVKGQIVPNHVTVKVGPDGVVTLKNVSLPGASVSLIADLAGFYVAGDATAAGSYNPLPPARILDTRTGTGAPQAPVAAGTSVELTVAGAGGIPADNVSAVALNVTAVNQTQESHVVVYPANLATAPDASNLNFQGGSGPIANAVTVKLSPDGKVKLSNVANGTVDLIADVAGYFVGGTPTQSGMYVPVAPARILDSRLGLGMPKNDSFSAGTARMLNNYETIAVAVAGKGGVPATATVPTAGAVVMNVTVARSTQAGYITIFPDGTARPNSSNLNYVQWQTVPNLATVKLGANGAVDFFAMSAGQSTVISDVAGYYIK